MYIAWGVALQDGALQLKKEIGEVMHCRVVFVLSRFASLVY
jgi:hypothetical protein